MESQEKLFGVGNKNIRFAFVCGLHRSGTSLVTRCLAAHSDISGFQGTGAVENEGQFLQSVLPIDLEYGGAGRFGFDPRAHLTETSDLNSGQTAHKILQDWRGHWEPGKSVLLEKSPANLLRMRLLQSLFQPSSFIVITRHPVATALATMKWTNSGIFRLLSHWVRCHEIARSDRAMVHRIAWISYEAFCADPQKHLIRLHKFLGLVPEPCLQVSILNQNERYFDLWRTRYLKHLDRSISQPPREDAFRSRLQSWLSKSVNKFEPRRRAHDLHDALDSVALFETAIEEFGYSFTDLEKIPNVSLGDSDWH